ncbi:MAG: penicillin acylase family protein, partial [Myxococcota bacterium]
GDIEQVPLEGISAFYSQGRAVERALPVKGAARSTKERSSSGMLATVPFREPGGSNGFAVAPSRTRHGHPLLLINPHTSLFFRGEVHVVSEEGLNAYGAVTWGQFFVYQGFNEHNGWMHTSTYVDFMDEFVQTVEADQKGLRYRYGDEWRRVSVEDIELTVRSDAVPTKRSFRLYRTHHGPVTHIKDGRWVVTRINWDPVNALRQSYLRMKTDGYPAFRKMMDIRTNSSNNTVYADDSGNIAYFHGNFVPRRDPRFDYSRPVDGSNPDTDWQGVHSVDEVIHLLNPSTGWIQNANSTPFTAAGASSPEQKNYPVYMAPDAQNFRGVKAVQMLADVDDLTLDGLIKLAYDSELTGFRKLLSGLIAAYDEASPSLPAMAEAIEVLRGWDHKVDVDSVAMSIAHFYGINMVQGVAAPAGLSRMQRIEWLGESSPNAARLRVFGETLEELRKKFGSWRTPWGQINRYQRLDGSIEPKFSDDQPSLPIGLASGRWGALASFAAPRRDDVDRLYGRGGNSFVAVVEFGPKIRAKTLLAGGQSGDSASPHFDDQAQRYADVAFKEVAFYRADVEARARRTYHPGEAL